MADGQVIFEIKGDPTNVNQTVKQVTNNIKDESKKWDQAVSDSTENAGKSFLNWKTVATGAVIAIGAAFVKLGREAVDAASDLQEVQNVVDTVFGDGAKQIDSWAQKAGEKFGLTETQAKRFTSTLGAMMKSSGLAGKEIIGMSTDLAGLAADMASFYNLNFDEAFQKIRSGISGETEPLKQLGINMSVANLEAFALAQGLEKTFSQMSQGEQVMLRYQYMMQATADAQGDFEKTSDGFANAQRRIQSSLESIKTSVGKLLIGPFEEATAGIANFLSQIASDMMPEKTIIDEFNDIEIDTTQKMADLQATYNKASDIIKLIDEIEKQTVTLNDGSTINFGKLFENIGEVEANGGDISRYLESLGLDVDSIIQKYNVWKESTRQLTSLVPSLTNVINSETGAIDGGTDALQKNLDEWKSYQEKKIAWAAYYAKEQALAEKKGALYLYEFDAGAARQAAKRAREQMQETYGAVFDENGAISYNTAVAMADSGPESQWFKDVAAYNKLLTDQWEKEKLLTEQSGDLVEAEQQLADGKAALIEKYGEEEQAAQQAGEAVVEWSDKQKAAGKEAVNATNTALKALADYIQGVRDSTEQAVNSVVKGFEKVTRAGDDARKNLEENSRELGEKEQQLAEYGGFDKIKAMDMDEWNRLSPEIQSAYNEVVRLRQAQDELNKAVDQYKPQGMMANLESQKTFMKDYLADLKAAQEMGLSADFLASLSDGSRESAEYLRNLVEAGPDAAKEVSDLYDEVQSQKKTFTDALADQKLAADETYDALVQKALEAIKQLDLSRDAETAMESTVAGLAQGIANKVPEVQSAVDSVIEQLDRLNNLGFSFYMPDFLSNAAKLFFPHFAGGTDWIPQNNFPAYLDYGEAVLTAEENKIWQMFKHGQQPASMDYDALGGVMRDNVKPGGNVYLDGRVVGNVISDQQGRSYRQLQRSGWQP